jgi:gas vesicle structural protein
MPRTLKPSRESSVADDVLETRESSVLDLLDSLLNKGVVANGEVTLGVAGIDLIYLRLSSILCAADRVLPPTEEPRKPRRRTRRSRR